MTDGMEIIGNGGKMEPHWFKEFILDGVQDGRMEVFDKNVKELPSVVFEMGVGGNEKLPKLNL